MSLMLWEPVRELQTIQQEMNRLFDAFFNVPTADRAGRRWIPAMDLVEDDDHVVLRADLPGLDENDVTVHVEDGVLTVSGERRAEHETRDDRFHRIERAAGRFSRSLTLPDGVDPEAITATFDKGVLEVRIPKPVEGRAKRVDIPVGRPAIEGRTSDAEA
jgi:HSP20 family protein